LQSATTNIKGAAMAEVTIYHNPRCSKSRETLALIQGQGVEPVIVEYLKTPPSVEELTRILALLGKGPRDILRKKEAAEAGLDPDALSDAELIQAMVAHPAVIERPIVVAGNKAALGRPPESVLDIL
jgi:arsenate reductase (glutaredoxin)